MSSYKEVLDALELSTAKIKDDKWLQEERAFFRQFPGLLKSLRGKWVAIHLEQVVEIGDSLHKVLLSVRKRCPRTEVHIQLVDEKLPVAKMVTPKR